MTSGSDLSPTVSHDTCCPPPRPLSPVFEEDNATSIRRQGVTWDMNVSDGLGTRKSL